MLMQSGDTAGEEVTWASVIHEIISCTSNISQSIVGKQTVTIVTNV